MVSSDSPEDLRCLKPVSLVDLLQILICPDCSGDLSVENSGYRCLGCGRNFPVCGRLVMLLPSNLEEAKKHEDGYYESHRLEGKGKPAWMTLALKREDIEFLKEVFLPRHKSRIKGRFLEIGSGSCWASSLIQKSYCSTLDRTIASDVSSVALQKGVEISHSMQANINYFINCDTERLPFKEGSFDVIFGSAIIHHFPNTEKGMSEIHRVLRKGGVYLGINETVTSNVFTLFSNSRLWHVHGRAEERGITEKVFGYSEWIRLFSQAGFKDVCVDLERDAKYKLRTSARTRTRWIMPIYYQLLSLLPDSLVRKYLASSISIVARK